MWRAAICVTAALSWAGVQSAPAPTATPFPVVGAKTGINKNTGQTPARLNINTLWARGGPQWDLYVLALSELQAMNETDELSYFGITGIHGFPHSAWNGVSHVDGAPNTGFCPHGQVLVSHAVRLAGEYPPNLQPEYVGAAQTLRQPYWDWAADSTLPPATYAINVTVRAPCGVIEIANPLRGYRFQQLPLESSFGGFLATYPQTIRCLGKGDLLSNITASNEAMVLAAKDLTTDVYDIFARERTFDSSGWRVSSLEFPHNLVHALLFNPKPGDIQADASSMLHHCNVDRLVAMWQVIHYEEDMFTNKGTSTGQYGTIESSIVTADSPLKPFFDENMNFLTSKSVRNITTFGYTYPEMPNWKMSPEARASYGRAQINSLYGEKDDDLRSARALKGAGYPSVIGRMSLLAVPRTGVASASLPLREVLVGNHSMRDLPPEKVVLFLQEEMTTEIRGSDGRQVPVTRVPSLHIQITSMEYIPRANDSSFPVFGNAQRWPAEVR
ncbi:hypothetical protein CHGG_09092 [Chaetomium globosum CBS 148.51]|uniref:Uncharacterized protein n=1 Tax=Chaetomium globosum (strain ATCC 6205 / CBS 148.51 / DSM 1962 / NBRC 6347 / NRRL 1970) TaxID=306901 RepID=Q2GSG2_CHAGB|nr:uncharacterized protein CHGG_09092 [Chaetomium globosum CBS 148.51]EAQ85078.1 hypothetical protein CHGG_09092 [Chaetomium globosum CBS 148.51]